MPDIAPFRALGYAKSIDLTHVVTPPYDVISSAEQRALESRHPHNFIRLELPPERPGDAPGEKYRRSAQTLEAWCKEGVLVRDEKPALYALSQTFKGPDGAHHTRRGFFALLKLHPFSDGVVLPHERTLSGPKADRMELIKQCKANLSPIFSLVPDEAGEVWKTLEPALGAADRRTAHSDDGVDHELWRVTDPAVIKAMRALVKSRKAFIADGHHRYETALGYRDFLERGATEASHSAGAHRYVLSFLCGMSDPGLVIYPTHRLVHGIAGFSLPTFLQLVAEFFEVTDLETDVPSAVRRLAEAGGPSHHAFLLAASDRRLRLLTLRDGVDTAHVHALPKNPTLRALDVSMLHGLLLQHVLGLSQESQERQVNLRYVKDSRMAVEQVFAGEAQLGFLLNPTPMWQVRAVAEAGEVMPQKSTYFFPKLASGLVVNLVNPTERVEV